MTVLIVLPGGVIQRTYAPLFQPPGDAMQVESMVAYTPRDGALFGRLRVLICLAVDARFHDVAFADRAVLHFNVSGPQRDGGPLLDLESFLAVGVATGASEMLVRGACAGVGFGFHLLLLVRDFLL